MADPPPAQIDKLKKIWESVLPHRGLTILSGNINTRTADGQEYNASEMSDGERVVFYLIAQALLAKPNSLLIFDEPELHINKSILAKLWDEIESARPDCAFLYITHDVDFASSRHAATKFALRSYRKTPREEWDIEAIPDDSHLPSDVIALIIGSRRPILFVEGNGGSLDSSIFRRVYKDFTVIPVGSCEHVIHTVASFAARPQLHRIGCAGIIDADGRTSEEKETLEKSGIYCLPVSEVENLLLLPNVFLEVAKALKFSDSESQKRLEALQAYVFDQAKKNIDDTCLRHTRRRIDRTIKAIGLTSKDIQSLESELASRIEAIDVNSIFSAGIDAITTAIKSQNYEAVLLHYDNKGLLAEMAKQLDYNQKALEEFIGRALRSEESKSLHSAIFEYVPTAVPRPQE